MFDNSATTSAEVSTVSLAKLGERIVEIYYPEINLRACFLPRFLKSSYQGPEGAASGAKPFSDGRANGLKGDDGERMVYKMLQEQLEPQNFAFHSYKYNDCVHKSLRKYDSELAQRIAELDLPKSEKNQAFNFELDFLIFSRRKGLWLIEVKSVNNSEATHQIECAENHLMLRYEFFRTIADYCGLPRSFPIYRLILLPCCSTDDRFGRDDTTGTWYVYGCPENWWKSLPTVNLDESKLLHSLQLFLFALVGLFALDHAGMSETNLKKHFDQATVTEDVRNSLESQSFLHTEKKTKRYHCYELPVNFLRKTRYFLTPEQWKIYNSADQKWRHIVGPAGSGKSLMMKQKAIDMALEQEHALLIVPQHLKQKYDQEMIMYRNEEFRTKFLHIIGFELDDTFRMRLCAENIPNTRCHIFVDELVWLLYVAEKYPGCIDPIDALLEKRHSSLYFWICGDSYQVRHLSPEFRRDSLERFSIDRERRLSVSVLTTSLRSTPEIVDSWSMYSGMKVIAGNRLKVLPVQEVFYRRYYGELYSRFVIDYEEFVLNTVIEYLLSSPGLMVNDEVVIVYDEVRRNKFVRNTLLQQLRELGLAPRVVTADHLKITSMEYTSVICIQSAVNHYFSVNDRRNTRFLYCAESRAKVNLLTIRYMEVGPSEICSYAGMFRYICSSTAKACESFHNLEYTFGKQMKVVIQCPFRFAEIEALYVAIVEKVCKQLLENFAKLNELPWSLPSIAVSYINDIIEGTSMVSRGGPVDNMGMRVLQGAFKVYSSSLSSHFVVRDGDGEGFLRSIWRDESTVVDRASVVPAVHLRWRGESEERVIAELLFIGFWDNLFAECFGHEQNSADRKDISFNSCHPVVQEAFWNDINSFVDALRNACKAKTSPVRSEKFLEDMLKSLKQPKPPEQSPRFSSVIAQLQAEVKQMVLNSSLFLKDELNANVDLLNNAVFDILVDSFCILIRSSADIMQFHPCQVDRDSNLIEPLYYKTLAYLRRLSDSFVDV